MFAALSYAITQSGRGGGSIDKETATITASQMTQYGANIRNAIMRMALTGTATGNISLQPDLNAAPCDSNPEYCVFSPSGGGVTFETPVGSPNPDHCGTFYGGYGADDEGGLQPGWGYQDVSDSGRGFYIDGLGSNTDVSGRDGFVSLRCVAESVCQQINRSLGLDPAPARTSRVNHQTSALNYTAGENVYDAFSGQAFACVVNAGVNGGDAYDYYHAVIEQ